jgi:membrane-associated phospholipid phosphatase
MAEGLFGFLRRDLREALAAGAARTPVASTQGALWVSHWAAAAAGAGLVLFLLVGYHAGFDRLNAAAAALPPLLWELVTVLGDERVAFALALLLARHRPRVFWTLICAGLVAAAYARGLKPLVDAARPPAVLAADAFNLIGPGHRRYSFPSGHTVTAGVFFGVLAYYAGRAQWRALFLLAALAVGVSRVALGVHWPVDVAAGIAGGSLAALAGVWLAQRSLWGVYDSAVHLAFVTISAIVAASLWVDDGGYSGAAPVLQLLAVVSIGYAVLSYLILPLRRGLFRRRADANAA